MKPLSAFNQIPLEGIQGLTPSVWLSVGPGFVREDLKALLLERGIGFTASAVTTLAEIALKIVAESRSERLISPMARQEVLRILLSERRINREMPELKRLRRTSC